MIMSTLSLISKAVETAIEKGESKDIISKKLSSIFNQFEGYVSDLPVSQLNYINDQMDLSIQKSMGIYSTGCFGCEDELKKVNVYKKFKKIVTSKLDALMEYGKGIEL